MNVPMISQMLQMFYEGARRYTPVYPGCTLEEETGDPSASTRNLEKLLAGDLFVTHVMLQPQEGGRCRAMILFNDGSQFVALGFGLNKPEKREALTRFASRIGYGEYERLKRFYDAIPEDFSGPLPAVLMDKPKIHRPGSN